MRVSPADLIAKYWHLTPQTNKMLGHPDLAHPDLAESDRREEDGDLPPAEHPGTAASPAPTERAEPQEEAPGVGLRTPSKAGDMTPEEILEHFHQFTPDVNKALR